MRRISRSQQQVGWEPATGPTDHDAEPASIVPASLPELLTAAQVAALLKRTPRTLRDWEKAGLLRRIPHLGRAVLFRRDEIERLIAGERP